MTAVHQAIRTGIAALIAFFFYQYFELAQGYWIVLTALFLVQIQLNDVFWKTIFFIFVCGIIIVCNVTIANFVAIPFIALAIYLFITTFLTIYFSLKQPIYIFPAFSINFFGILSGGLNVDNDVLIFRVGCILVGILIAVLIRCILWPIRVTKRFKQFIADSLLAIDKLQLKLFSIYLTRDYNDSHYSHERELHQKRLHFFNITQKIRELLSKLPQDQREKGRMILDHINSLFEVIIASGNLRYRIKDHTTFEIAEKELREIAKKISISINNIVNKIFNAKSTINPIVDWDKDIQSFEEIYRTTLQVVSKEPIIFLIFIQDLKMIEDKIKLIAKDIPI